MNIVATITAQQATEELKHDLRVAQSSIRPHPRRVQQIQADLKVFSALPPQNTVWIDEEGDYHNFMD